MYTKVNVHMVDIMCAVTPPYQGTRPQWQPNRSAARQGLSIFFIRRVADILLCGNLERRHMVQQQLTPYNSLCY